MAVTRLTTLHLNTHLLLSCPSTTSSHYFSLLCLLYTNLLHPCPYQFSKFRYEIHQKTQPENLVRLQKRPIHGIQIRSIIVWLRYRLLLLLRLLLRVHLRCSQDRFSDSYQHFATSIG